MEADPARWRLLETIFYEVVDSPPGERPARLRSHCGGEGLFDEGLFDDVNSLLSAYDTTESLTISNAPAGEPEHVDASIGQQVGPYRLERLLGRGGMGAVYLAMRVDGQFDQQVAIKLVDLPLASDLFRERFRQERQILARLNHPFIAKLLDGGVSEAGELYLAMEYVDGLPIGRYCAQRALPLPDRMALFKSVCSAVRFAHQNLVVHRDLKPDNIIVREDGTPKLLDFGTAKLLTPAEIGAEGEFTRLGFHSFTPQYASPEQVLGNPITTASDIYSLGVLLFFLTTGVAPYELKEFTTAEMVRVICEEQPPKPSEKATIGKLDSDIDAIVLKALRKEPEERYASVDQLIADLDAYLDGRPVAAHRGSWRYWAGKFARRNKLALAAAALLAATLMTGIAGILWQARVADAERHRAEARLEDLRKLSNTLISDIDEAIQKLPGSIPAQRLLVATVLEHLDRTAKDASGDPRLQLDIVNAYTKLGNVQGNPYDQNIGDHQGALVSLGKALSIATALVRKEPENAAAVRALGWVQQSRSEVFFGMDKPQEAVSTMRLAVASFDQLASRPGAKVDALIDAATAYGGLGDALGSPGAASLSDPAGALAAYQKTLEIDRRILKADPTNARVLRGLALCLLKTAAIKADTDPAAALPDYQKAIDGMRALPEDARKSLSNQRILANVIRKKGQGLSEIGSYSDALSHFQQARAILEPFIAADPNDTRAGHDMISVLENEAECFEDRSDGVFTYEKGNREEDAASALRVLSELRSRLEKQQRLEPGTLDWKAILGLTLIRMSLQQRTLGVSAESPALAERGVTMLRDVGVQKDAQGYDLDQVATGLLIVAPEHLREPPLAVKYAERIVEMSHRRRPGYLLTLATAYRADGKPANAREVAREGLGLLPASTSATIPSRTRRELEAEAAK